MLYAIDKQAISSKTQLALAALVLTVTTANLATAAEFIPLGMLPDHDDSFGYGISDDGAVVAGVSEQVITSSQPRYREAFRWTEETGMVGLGVTEGYEVSTAGYLGEQSVSSDGSTIVGRLSVYGSTAAPFRYTSDNGYEVLANFSGNAAGVSADGSAVVIENYDTRRTFRWTQTDGLQPLGVLPGDAATRPGDISRDGSVIVGASGEESNGANSWELYRWTESTGIVGIGINAADWRIQTTDDGATLAGTAYIGSADELEAFYWTEDEAVVGLGWLPHTESGDLWRSSRVRDMTPDGRVIAGWSAVVPRGTPFNDHEMAFIWTKAAGMQDFQQILADDLGLGGMLDGWQLRTIFAMSSNAQFFTGVGTNPDGENEAWLVRLDAPWGTQPIPEPTTAAIALLALVPLAMWRTRRAGRVLALLMIGVMTANLATAAEFIPLGTLPGFETSLAFGVSDDGGVVAGTAYNVDPADGLSHFEAFRWTDASGIRGLGKLPGAERSYASESPLSGDGSTVVGYSYDEHAFYSTTAALFDSRSRPRSFDANQDNSVSQGVAVSRDGAILLGRVRYLTNNGESDLVEPYIWTADNGAHLLGHPRTTQTATEATDLSPDGTVVVGRSRRSIHDSSNNPVDVGDWELFRWTESGGMEPLGIEVASGPVKVSLDGAMIAGTIPSSSATDVLNAFLWTETTGIQSLGSLPSAPMGDSSVQDMSPDGRFIVGSSGGRAFVWTPDGGMEDFMQVLESQYDLSDALQGWELTTIQAVSANGQFFTGFSKKSTGYHEAWLVRLDAPWGTTAIPEPTTAALALLALAPLAVRRTRCVPQ